ncbi:MAG: hypothetical protein ABJ059_16585 [Hyphomicrobiales bacterium]
MTRLAASLAFAVYQKRAFGSLFSSTKVVGTMFGFFSPSESVWSCLGSNGMGSLGAGGTFFLVSHVRLACAAVGLL